MLFSVDFNSDCVNRGRRASLVGRSFGIEIRVRNMISASIYSLLLSSSSSRIMSSLRRIIVETVLSLSVSMLSVRSK